MILCVWFDYHILCAFPAAQIRFLAVPDLRAPAGAQRPGSTKCSGVLS